MLCHVSSAQTSYEELLHFCFEEQKEGQMFLLNTAAGYMFITAVKEKSNRE